MENLKEIQVIIDGKIVIGYIDKNSQPLVGVEVFFTNDNGELESPLDDIYILAEYSYSVEIKGGIIQ